MKKTPLRKVEMTLGCVSTGAGGTECHFNFAQKAPFLDCTDNRQPHSFSGPTVGKIRAALEQVRGRRIYCLHLPREISYGESFASREHSGWISLDRSV
jgi:hypothetical protein